jgi:C1A family cysteine protease
LLYFVIGAYEYLTKRANGYEIDVSRLFIYYNARAHNHQSGNLTDSGCSMTNGIETLQQYGVCPESMWPYNVANVNARPDQKSYEAADDFKITEALQVDIDLHQMKSCLAQGFPFAFGLKLFTSFDKAARSGAVPMPDQDEQRRESHAGQFMTIAY